MQKSPASKRVKRKHSDVDDTDVVSPVASDAPAAQRTPSTLEEFKEFIRTTATPADIALIQQWSKERLDALAAQHKVQRIFLLTCL